MAAIAIEEIQMVPKREAVSQDRLSEFCRFNLPPRAFRYIADAAGWSQS